MRDFFPYFTESKLPVYLDTAATGQKLASVIDLQYQFQSQEYASVHRAAYHTASIATQRYEETRTAVAHWINVNANEVVFTSGATESINLVANGLSSNMLNGNKILMCASEHHANLLPWQRLAKRYNLTIEILPLSADGAFDRETLDIWLSKFSHDCALFICAHASNVLGNIYPIESLCAKAKSVNAISIIDGTQAVAHMKVDAGALGCDFYAFSGHKMYSSTGVGVLFGRYQLLLELSPLTIGGEMVATATYDDFESQPPPLKFEAGTPNISGVLSLLPAIKFLSQNIQEICAIEQSLLIYLREQLSTFPNLRILGNEQGNVGIISFLFPNKDNYALAMHLWQQNIAVRYGQHCAMPLIQSLGINACLRISLGCYSQQQDIDACLQSMRQWLNPASNKNTPLNNKHVILRDIKSATDWSSKNRSLMLLSKYLPDLSAASRIEENQINGCESQVWIAKEGDGSWRGFSDSKTMRGILALLFDHIDDSSTPQSLERVLSDYGLLNYFSVGRRNGVTQLILAIFDD